jgi:signal transduction histidine kinase
MEPVQWEGMRWWSQAGILFNVLWGTLGVLTLGPLFGKAKPDQPSPARGALSLPGFWTFWTVWYLAWVLILDAANTKTGWANPLTWSLDDAAMVFAMMVVMILVAGTMRRPVMVGGGSWRYVLLGTLVSGAVLVFGGVAAGWTLWGWLLGAGYGAWLGIGWLWKRFSHSAWGRNLVLALMGLLCFVLFYGQHWRIQAKEAQGQLATLVEPRPLEAYAFFDSFIDSLRGDADWLDSTAGPSKNMSRIILDRHYSELNPFFDLLSSEFIPGTTGSLISADSSAMQPVTVWQGSVQEFQQQGRNAYRLRIGVGFANSVPDTLEVILAQKFFPTLSPIPSILGTGNSWSGSPGRSGLALYENGKLVFQNGTYAYPFLLPEQWLNRNVLDKLRPEYGNLTESVSPKTWYRANRSRTPSPWALAISNDGRPVLIFSKGRNQVAAQILEMPSLMMPLALGALMSIFVWWLLRFSAGKTRNKGWNIVRWSALRFQTKVQWATTVLVILVIVALVGFTIFFISRQYRNESRASMLAQLQQFHSMSQGLILAEGALNDNTVRAMRDRAALNDIDFFLYDADGRFLSGSRDLWFERGLVSDYMPYSLWKSFGEGRFQFQLIDEKIGQVDYLSAYHTLLSPQGSLIGFVNLPFVNKAPRGAPELNQYLAGVISVFTLVLLLSVLMAYRLAKGVASPIQVLTKALLQAKTGRKITLDEQMSGGEFGLMLKSYNQMVQSLTENEKRLAEAERNTAWKEMARQIAHDIKNPLTPMKLRIQRLMRDYSGNPEGFANKFESDAQSVLQQIDLLTEIADTYRDFSRESEADKSLIVWNELIREVAGWFSEQCVVDWLVEPRAASACVLGNAGRLQRVLQNLFQNAIQAKGEDASKAKVRIILSQAEEEIILEMVDQGTGISQEMQNRLFELNFTTRSQGLGVGLAMSRKIVEQHGGNLRLNYSDERGTAFVWAMPLYDPNSERSVS